MIKIEKDFQDIPAILKSQNRKDAFGKNIKAKSFVSGKTLYKTDGVKSRI